MSIADGMMRLQQVWQTRQTSSTYHSCQSLMVWCVFNRFDRHKPLLGQNVAVQHLFSTRYESTMSLAMPGRSKMVCAVCVVEGRSVVANSRAVAAQRCLYRLKHLIELPCHAEKTDVTEPLRSVFVRRQLITRVELSVNEWLECVVPPVTELFNVCCSSLS